ncbi:hypothetical protein KCU59_g172, partial [Aureobasidium melanogenum]
MTVNDCIDLGVDHADKVGGNIGCRDRAANHNNTLAFISISTAILQTLYSWNIRHIEVSACDNHSVEPLNPPVILFVFLSSQDLRSHYSSAGRFSHDRLLGILHSNHIDIGLKIRVDRRVCPAWLSIPWTLQNWLVELVVAYLRTYPYSQLSLMVLKTGTNYGICNNKANQGKIHLPASSWTFLPVKNTDLIKHLFSSQGIYCDCSRWTSTNYGYSSEFIGHHLRGIRSQNCLGPKLIACEVRTLASLCTSLCAKLQEVLRNECIYKKNKNQRQEKGATTKRSEGVEQHGDLPRRDMGKEIGGITQNYSALGDRQIARVKGDLVSFPSSPLRSQLHNISSATPQCRIHRSCMAQIPPHAHVGECAAALYGNLVAFQYKYLTEVSDHFMSFTATFINVPAFVMDLNTTSSRSPTARGSGMIQDLPPFLLPARLTFISARRTSRCFRLLFLRSTLSPPGRNTDAANAFNAEFKNSLNSLLEISIPCSSLSTSILLSLACSLIVLRQTLRSSRSGYSSKASAFSSLISAFHFPSASSVVIGLSIRLPLLVMMPSLTAAIASFGYRASIALLSASYMFLAFDTLFFNQAPHALYYEGCCSVELQTNEMIQLKAPETNVLEFGILVYT